MEGISEDSMVGLRALVEKGMFQVTFAFLSNNYIARGKAHGVEYPLTAIYLTWSPFPLKVEWNDPAIIDHAYTTPFGLSIYLIANIQPVYEGGKISLELEKRRTFSRENSGRIRGEMGNRRK